MAVNRLANFAAIETWGFDTPRKYDKTKHFFNEVWIQSNEQQNENMTQSE